jgi:hypothetical protein
VRVQDTPSGFGVGWSISKDDPPYVTCELRNVGEPGTGSEEHGGGKYYAAMTWDQSCDNSSLTVKNARLDKTWMALWGFVHLKVYNSNVADTHIQASLGNIYAPISTEEIYGSTIQQIFDNGGGRVSVGKSEISDFIDVRDPNSVVYGYGVTWPIPLLLRWSSPVPPGASPGLDA